MKTISSGIKTSSQRFTDVKERVVDLVRNKRTQLPTLPVVAQKILELAQDEDTSARDLEIFIAKDQAIANKVLKLANSSYYGMGRSVDTIDRAIMLIGFDEIVSLTIGMSVFPVLQPGSRRSLLNMQDLWVHSLGASYAARRVCSQIDNQIAFCKKSVFLVSLLHDIGKAIFSIYFPDEYAVVLEEADKNQVPLYQMEEELLGIDHGNMASMLMHLWNFPESFIQAVRHHHTPELSEDELHHNALLIQLANSLSHAAEIGKSGSPCVDDPLEIGEKLGFLPGYIEDCVEFLRSLRPEISAFFGTSE